MSVFITKSGMILLLIIAIVVGISVFCGGCMMISNIVENHRVNKVNGNLNATFSITDIKYDKNFVSLRSEFKAHYEKIDAAGIGIDVYCGPFCRLARRKTGRKQTQIAVDRFFPHASGQSLSGKAQGYSGFTGGCLYVYQSPG